ncbi:alkaline phosphatase D family protein [Legionella dresdenensis]|uniref:Alkaline phosphatase D family protein n=1 Tax=Legionella dresdenensis TaxID=450200 RepID=A0ABV8CH42_9GAMM
MPGNAHVKLPSIKNILFGELTYIDYEGDVEPAIEDDRVSIKAALRLDKSYEYTDFTLMLASQNEEKPIVMYIPAENADSRAIKKGKTKAGFLHFPLRELNCNESYGYQILYKGKPLQIFKDKHPPEDTQVFIRTPPARQDPLPIKIAVGGDQERMEQFNPLGACLGLDNQKYTSLLYTHIKSQPFNLFAHLGDLYNGEWFISFQNLFRRGRKFIEYQVRSLQAYRANLAGDFGTPAENNLAHIAGGTCVVVDDHDIGQNNAGPPVTNKQKKAQRKMVDAFHEMGLMQDFLAADKEGPYFNTRIGQHEFFFLNNRFTQNRTSEEAYLLGDKQWAWLEASLAGSKAGNKIIVSPLPLAMGKSPTEDYRGHPKEWHRFMQLCRKYSVGAVLTADSHNYSHTEFHVREFPDDKPWIVNQHLVGTLGGKAQHITAEEKKSINLLGRQPLMPEDAKIKELYRGSRVKAYFSPDENQALLPHEGEESEWTKPGEWEKDTYGYLGITLSSEPEEDNEQGNVIFQEENGDQIEMVNFHSRKNRENRDNVSVGRVEAAFFACTKKSGVVREEPRLAFRY